MVLFSAIVHGNVVTFIWRIIGSAVGLKLNCGLLHSQGNETVFNVLCCCVSASVVFNSSCMRENVNSWFWNKTYLSIMKYALIWLSSIWWVSLLILQADLNGLYRWIISIYKCLKVRETKNCLLDQNIKFRVIFSLKQTGLPNRNMKYSVWIVYLCPNDLHNRRTADIKRSLAEMLVSLWFTRHRYLIHQTHVVSGTDQLQFVTKLKPI